MAKGKPIIAELKLPSGKSIVRECASEDEARRVIQFWIAEMKAAGIEMAEVSLHDRKQMVLH